MRQRRHRGWAAGYAENSARRQGNRAAQREPLRRWAAHRKSSPLPKGIAALSLLNQPALGGVERVAGGKHGHQLHLQGAWAGLAVWESQASGLPAGA